MSSNMIPMHERIHRRSGHIAVTYKDYLLVWGGYMEQIIEVPNSQVHIHQEYHYVDEVWAYDCNTEIWERIVTTGDIPPKMCGSCGLVLNDFLYVFGGYCNDDSFVGNSNRLYRLDLRTWVWHMQNPAGSGPAPVACDKLVGWTYKNKLYFFGGFGPAPTCIVPFRHVPAETMYGYDTRGWINQLVVYNPVNDEWEWPKVGGKCPSPRAAHAADIAGDKVFIFGGRFRYHRTNDLFCLDLGKMLWSDNLTDAASSSVPEGRSWHSFTVVSPERAVLYGGFSNANTVLSDCWWLDVVHLSWQPLVHVKLPPKGRHWHGAAKVKHQLICVGEANKLPDHADEMLVIDFSPKSLLRLSMDAVLTTVPRQLWMGAPNGESCLPRTLEALLRRRFEQAHALPSLQCS